MNIFVINAGSSSLKFQVIATDLERIRQDNDEFLCRGQVERIGGEAIVTVQSRAGLRQKLPIVFDSRLDIHLKISHPLLALRLQGLRLGQQLLKSFSR